MIALSALWLQNAITTIISFAAVGIYIAFQMIVLAALDRAREGLAARRALHPGCLGLAGQLAGARLRRRRHRQYPVAAPDAADPWYAIYGMVVTTVGVVLIGGAYMVLAKPYARGNAPAGDAHLLAGAKRPALDSAH